jgi:hypothetical protein
LSLEGRRVIRPISPRFWLNVLLTATVLLLAGGAAAQTAESPPFVVSDIKANEVSPGVIDVKLTTTVVTPVPAVPTVPVPTAPLQLNGQIPMRQLLNNDIMESFYATNLSGDGPMGAVLVRESEHGLRFNGALVEAMGPRNGPQRPYREDGKKMRRYTLSPDWFSVLYYEPPSLGLLLGHRGDDPQVLELPNPHLQLVVFEHSDPVENPRFMPAPPAFGLTIDGQDPAQKHLVYAWEPELFASVGRPARWLRGYWIAVPLNNQPGSTEHDLRVTVGSGDSSLGLYAQVNYAVEPGTRLWTSRSVGLIWSPAAKK